MLFLNDVWVNWFEGEKLGYNVCHFHEWKKEDSLELLDQVPVLKVRQALYERIEGQMLDLPDSLLKMVRNQCFVRKSNERVQLEYCFIISDGKNILAVDTAGYRFPLRKSRLTPRQETVVYEMLEGKREHILTPFLYKKVENEFSLQQPDPQYMIGLTREERTKKQMLFLAMEHLLREQNMAQLKYWYTEWEPTIYNQWKAMAYKDLWLQFYHDVSKGWSKKHEQFTEQIVKGVKGLEQAVLTERSLK